MQVAFCYESVLPNRGGCERYIAALARRLVTDGHDVHLYACRWDATALPDRLHYHPIVMPRVPRFLRPWVFSVACLRALQDCPGQISIGFDKTWGQDILYPQGGLYRATADHNLLKYRSHWARGLVRFLKQIDPAHWSYWTLERRQYLGAQRPLIIAISNMVRHHFQQYYQIPAEQLRVVRIATDPGRFDVTDRLRRRAECRQRWQLNAHDPVALFAGMNYRLKGLEPLLHALRLIPPERGLRLLVVGSPEVARFQRLARRLGVEEQVRLVGYCSDMRDAYFAADFFVHPTFYDPCSHVVPEAMACGLPVITTRYNGASELMSIPAEGILLNDPHDHVWLARCMEKMLESSYRLGCAQAARYSALRWTFEHHYQQMLAVFAEAARRRVAA